MFAVPGWSLSPTLLKTQDASSGGDQAGQATRISRKRKRRQSTNGPIQVNSSNVADLWRQHVEGKGPQPMGNLGDSKYHPKEEGINESKNSKKMRPKSAALPSATHGIVSMQETPPVPKKPSKRSAEANFKNRTERHLQDPSPQTAPATETSSGAKLPTNAPTGDKVVLKLTPLQAAMRQKLISARFRHLNQTLYTAPSAETQRLFDTNPSFFDEYHEGFRQQVSTWPENPVDTFVLELQQRGKIKDKRRDKRRQQPMDVVVREGKQDLALPRTSGCCTVADLGCGDAALANKIAKTGKKFNINVLSYDLQNTNHLVTKADIANLPLASGSVDVAIFCLALMGTNWLEFVDEAWRILHWKGELWVAEIKSRFGRPSKKQVEHSVGNRRKIQRKSGQAEIDSGKVNEQLNVEIDGQDGSRQQTDVSAFVQVLQKRGFVIAGESAVDLSNKMFVRLKFTKSSSPMKGKNVKDLEERPGMKGQRKRFLDDDRDDDTTIDESSILKPCLYKIR